MTQYRDKRHPLRECCIVDIKRQGTEKMRFTLCYSVDTETRTTWHRQPVQISLCDARGFAVQLHKIADELQSQLNLFRADISGQNR